MPAGGDLQAAIDAAQGGDVILLQPGATYVGNFVLRNKPGITTPIVIRSAASDGLLPGPGIRITPAYAAHLPKIKSSNTMPALRTATAAHHWTLRFLEFQANVGGYSDIIALGAADSTQTDLSQVPHHLVIDRVYIHGDPLIGQKRAIGLNSRDTDIINSYISDCKVVGQDSQAIGSFNGPGNYLIENNYLEGAGENVMFGGADPEIPNLVPTNIVLRRNHMRKPVEWRDPIVPAVAGLTATGTGGGSLPAGTYFYKVAARRKTAQGAMATSATPVQVSATVGAGGAVTLTWSPVVGADDYVIYGRSNGAQNMYWKTTSPVFTDAGGAGSSGAPVKPTIWVVKNVFELKNAQDVLVEGNVMENLWVGGQSGYPVALTPRNQGGDAPWSVVQRVVLRHNLIRHTAGGVNILGTDDLQPSQYTNHITIEHNVFDDLTAATWGSGSRFLLVGDGSDSITVNHNTVFTTNSSLVFFYGAQITNFVFTNNMFPHNSYGIMGQGYTYGVATISAYLPGGIVDRNVIAGGPSSKYPAGNFFPTEAAWQSAFVDYGGGDYHLTPGGPYSNAGTDGTDLGADIDRVSADAAAALSGNNNGSDTSTPVQIITSSLSDGVVNQPYAETLVCAGSTAPCGWVLHDSSLPAGLSFDNVAAVISGTPTQAGTGAITVEAYDPSAPTNSATKTLQLTVAASALSIALPATASGRVGQPFQVVPGISGALGTVAWSLSSGSLPSNVVLNGSTGVLSGVPASWGVTTAVIRATDSWGAGRTAEQPITIAIEPAPLQVIAAALPAATYGMSYFAALGASGGTGSTAWTITSGSLPAGISLTAAGVLTGTPAAAGDFPFTVLASDASWPGMTSSASFTLSVGSPGLAVVVPSSGPATVGAPYSITPAVSGALGAVSWSIASGTLPGGLALNTVTGVIAGVPSAAGTFNFVVQARDVSTIVRTASAPATVVVNPASSAVVNEIVLYAHRAAAISGAWRIEDDPTAAGGRALSTPDRKSKKISATNRSPSTYFELTFHATAGTPYHIWVRGKAAGDSWANDSIYVQFSQSADAFGMPAYRIGTTSAMTVSIEDGMNAGLSAWGWGDGAYGTLDDPITFTASGAQTVRIQPREDGLAIDQVVISAAKYFSLPPGAAKNDTTILAENTGEPLTESELPPAPPPPAPEPTTDPREIVLYAADASSMAGTWSLVPDGSAAAGFRVWNANVNAAKLSTALASPANYFEITFDALAGVPYHLWLRGKADNDFWGNDSVFVQFTNTVDAGGAPVFRIGTTSANVVSIENGLNAGLSGWGWQDGSYSGLDEPIVFNTSGRQTIRVQVREDGLSIDQVVLSNIRFATAAPGATKDDTTIVAK